VIITKLQVAPVELVVSSWDERSGIWA